MQWIIDYDEIGLKETFADVDYSNITVENVDDLYQLFYEHDLLYDAINEFRSSGIETNLECDWSRHYESKAVARQMPDGSWIGWTYWYGGGKHGEPQAIDWMDDAYDVTVIEEEKLVTVRTFTKV